MMKYSLILSMVVCSMCMGSSSNDPKKSSRGALARISSMLPSNPLGPKSGAAPQTPDAPLCMHFAQNGITSGLYLYKVIETTEWVIDSKTNQKVSRRAKNTEVAICFDTSKCTTSNDFVNMMNSHKSTLGLNFTPPSSRPENLMHQPYNLTKEQILKWIYNSEVTVTYLQGTGSNSNDHCFILHCRMDNGLEFSIFISFKNLIQKPTITGAIYSFKNACNQNNQPAVTYGKSNNSLSDYLTGLFGMLGLN